MKCRAQPLILSQLAAHDVVKRPLELRIAIEVQGRREAHHTRRADLRGLGELRDAHEGHVLILTEYVLGDPSLSRRERAPPAIQKLDNSTTFGHSVRPFLGVPDSSHT